MENDLKILLQQRKLNDAVPMLEGIGVKGLETLELLEDAEINVMVEKHGLPLMTGKLLKKELQSLAPALTQKRKEEEDETKRLEEEAIKEAKRRLFEKAVVAAKRKEELAAAAQK